MSREGQAMCFFAGANSIFEGEKPKWTRPDHKIERSELAKAKAKQ